jgi:phosphoribosylformylglycinamidine synthase PurS subunit
MPTAKIHVTLKQGVLDPQGKAIHHALESLGFAGVEDVRMGKLIEMELAGGRTPEALHTEVQEMCERLLANTVIEDYRFEIE